MKPIVLVILASALLMLMSCGNETNEDITNEVNKNGAIESSVTVEHLDSLHDVLITKHNVWNMNSNTETIVHRDTIPALGKMNTTAENEDGDTKNVEVKKDYEVFITVK